MNTHSVTFSKLQGPSDDRESDIIVNGVTVGYIRSSKTINYRPAKHVDFAMVEVVIFAQDEEATFPAPQYDATTALAAAKTWARAALAVRA